MDVIDDTALLTAATTTGTGDPVVALALDAAGRLVVARAGTGAVSVLAPVAATTGAEPTVTATIEGVGEPFAVAAHGTRAYIGVVTPSSDAVAVLDTTTGDLLDVHPLTGSARELAVAPDGRRLFVSRDGADLAVIDTATGGVDTVALPWPATTADALIVAAGGEVVAVATGDGHGGALCLVDTAAGRVLAVVRTGVVRALAAAPDGAHVLAATAAPAGGSELLSVDVRTGAVRTLAKTEDEILAMTCTRDGRRAHAVTTTTLLALDAATGDVLAARTPGKALLCAAADAGGTGIAVGAADGAVHVFAARPE